MSDFDKKQVLQQMTIWSELDLYENWLWWMICSEKVDFRSFYTAKTPISSIMRFLKNHDMEKKWIKTSLWMKTLEKNQILKVTFNNASDFESRISKYVRFSVNFKQLVIFGIGIFTACQILKHPFYHKSDSDQKF